MLKLSKKWDYTIKTIVFLLNNPEKLFKISEISGSLNISETFLRRIISELEKSGILMTKKGRNGWIFLTQDIKNYSLFDVLNATWEELWISNCTKWFCKNKKTCDTSYVYNLLQKSFNGILKTYTLDKLRK